MDNLLLSDGSTITFDLSKVTHKEFAAFWNGNADEEARGEFFVKVCGMTVEKLDNLPELDWRKFKQKLNSVCFSPIEESAKNSPSAST